MEASKKRKLRGQSTLDSFLKPRGSVDDFNVVIDNQENGGRRTEKLPKVENGGPDEPGGEMMDYTTALKLVQEGRALKRRKSFLSHLLDTQITGRYSLELQQNSFMMGITHFREMACMDVVSQSRRDAIADIVFDSLGELFLTCKMTGEMLVVDFEYFKEAVEEENNILNGNAPSVMPDSSLVLRIRCQDRLRVARWHPTNQNVVATVGGCSREVFVYNLETYVDSPKLILKVNNSAHLELGSMSSGFNDLQFFHHRSDNLLAADRGGQIFLWDARCSKHPTHALTSRYQSRSGATRDILCVTFGDAEENIVVGGTSSGEILKWDLRKIRGWATNPYDQVPIEYPSWPRGQQWGVHSILQKPKDPRQLAFVAVSGQSQWSGMIDLFTNDIVHLYMKPTSQSSESEEQPMDNVRKCRQKASWLSSSCTLLAGSVSEAGLTATYFADCPSIKLKNGKLEKASTKPLEASHSYDSSTAENIPGPADLWVSEQKRAASVGITGAVSYIDPVMEAPKANDLDSSAMLCIGSSGLVSCVACHPSSDDIIAGTMDGMMSYISQANSQA